MKQPRHQPGLHSKEAWPILAPQLPSVVLKGFARCNCCEEEDVECAAARLAHANEEVGRFRVSPRGARTAVVTLAPTTGC